MPSLPPATIVTEFQKRRRRTLYQAVLPGLSGFLAVLLMIAITNGRPDGTSVVIILTGFLVFAFGIVNVNRMYRCPACGNVVVNTGGGHRHYPLDPEHCPTCDATLKTHKHIKLNL